MADPQTRATSSLLLRSFLIRLVPSVLLINLFVIGLAVYTLHLTWEQHKRRAAILSEDLALSLELNIANFIEKADVALFAVVDEAQRQLAGGGIRKETLNAYISRQLSRIPEINGIRMTDAQGNTWYGTEVVPGHIVNARDRDYFINARSNPGNELFISKPLIGRVTKRYVLVLSRRVNNPDGTFAGVAYATFTIEYFTNMFARFNIGKHGVITLLDREIAIIARYPAPKGGGTGVGITSISSALQQVIRSGKESVTYQGTSRIDGIERIFSYRKISRYPLYLVVGQASRDYREEWLREGINIIILVTLFALGTVATAWHLFRNWKRENLAHAELLRYREHLEELVAARTSELEMKNIELREAQHIAHLGSWTHDHRTGMLTWSEEIYRILEIDPATPPSYRLFLDAVHPDDRSFVDASYRESIRTRTPYSRTHRLLFHDGRIKHVHEQGETFFGSDGTPSRSVGTVQDVTARKEADEALRLSEERLKLSLQSAGSGVWDWDLIGGSLVCSHELLELFGLDPDTTEVAFDLWRQAIHPDDVDQALSRLNQAIGNGTMVTNDYRIVRPDGELRWIRALGRAVYDEAGRPVRMIGICIDITEIKRKEEALQESQRLLMMALRAGRMIYFSWDPVADRMTTGGDFEGIYGRPPVTNSESGFALVHPEDQAHHRRIIEQAARNGGSYAFEYRTIRPDDGATVWLEDRGEVLLDQQQRVSMIIGTATDITERKRAEAEIQRLKNYLANVIDSMPSILVGIDRQGKVLQWNRQAEITTGTAAADAVGKEVEPLLHEFAPWIASMRGDVEKERQPVSMENLLILKNGDRHFYDLMLYPLVANGVEGAVARIEDVTERARIQELMVQTEKMMSLGGLAAGMAHEINNPLGIVSYAVQNIERRISSDLPANVKTAAACGLDLGQLGAYLEQRGIPSFIRDIREAIDRAATIVSNMLQFSRRSEPHMEPTQLEELIDRTVELASSDYDLKKKYDFRSIEIHREFTPGIPPVPVVRVEIEQVLLNILKNAAQAMIANPPGRKPSLTLRLRREERYVLMEVADNGPGMTEEVMRRIFEPFFTTKEVGVGTGLGLSVSYMIVTQNHKGQLSVRSAPGQGACFSVRLPIEQGE